MTKKKIRPVPLIQDLKEEDQKLELAFQKLQENDIKASRKIYRQVQTLINQYQETIIWGLNDKPGKKYSQKTINNLQKCSDKWEERLPMLGKKGVPFYNWFQSVIRDYDVEDIEQPPIEDQITQDVPDRKKSSLKSLRSWFSSPIRDYGFDELGEELPSVVK